MPNKDTKPHREKLLEEYEDSLFKLAMYDLAAEEGKLLLEENKKLKNDPDFQPGEAAYQKFAEQLDIHLKKKEAHTTRRNRPKLLSKFAIAASIAVLLLFTTVASVEAVRLRVLNFLVDVRQEYTSFSLKESENNSYSETPAVNWSKSYVPTYIPEGYEVSSISDGSLSKIIEFVNSQGSLITYMELSEGNKILLDTENASDFETIKINEHEGSMVMKNFLVTIIWAMDERMFLIRGEVEKNAVIKMAEGVKYVD